MGRGGVVHEKTPLSIGMTGTSRDFVFSVLGVPPKSFLLWLVGVYDFIRHQLISGKGIVTYSIWILLSWAKVDNLIIPFSS